MVKIGIIGCGGMGRTHAHRLKAMSNVRIVSVCDLVEQKAAKLADAVGSKPCTDFRTQLDEVDAVFVCTEPFNRVEIVKAAAQAGRHIFSEKPIALNLADADEMIRAAEAAGVRYMLGYVLRFTQPFKLLRETFAGGELGRLVNCWTRRYMPMDPRSNWYGRQDKSGGVALDFGSHDIDWLMWIGGPVRTVFARADRIRQDVQADEHCQAMLAFAEGGMGSVDVSWWDSVAQSSIGIVGTAGSMSVGRDGVVRKKLAGCEEVTLSIETAMEVDPSGHVGKKTADGNIAEAPAPDETIQQHFIRCVEEDRPPAVTGRDGRAVLATVLAIRQSAETGKSVDLPDS